MQIAYTYSRMHMHWTCVHLEMQLCGVLLVTLLLQQISSSNSSPTLVLPNSLSSSSSRSAASMLIYAYRAAAKPAARGSMQCVRACVCRRRRLTLLLVREHGEKLHYMRLPHGSTMQCSADSAVRCRLQCNAACSAMPPAVQCHAEEK